MGQIQTPQMELEAFCAQLAPVFLEYLRTHGTAVDRIEVATSRHATHWAGSRKMSSRH